MSWWQRYKLWMSVYETGGGWFVERDGEVVAVLTDPEFVDMFWLAWRLEPLSDNQEKRTVVFTKEYWTDELLPRTIFRSREYGTIAPGFWAGGNPVRDGRIVMRGLHQPISEPWPWDWIALWMRSRLAKNSKAVTT